MVCYACKLYYFLKVTSSFFVLDAMRILLLIFVLVSTLITPRRGIEKQKRLEIK